MSQSISDTLAELIAMRAAGEITPDEFMAARDRLRDADGSFSVEGRAVLAAARSAAAPGLAPSDAAARERLQASGQVEGRASSVESRAAPAPTDVGANNGSAARQVREPWTLRQKMAAWALASLAGGAFWLGSSPSEITYYKTSFGEAWPYPSHNSATVRCVVKTFGPTDRPVVTIELGGKIYGLNGAALGIGRYPDPRPLQGPDLASYMRTTDRMLRDGLSKICHWQD